MNETLSPCQVAARDAFNTFLEGDKKYFILTGGPGRGKTFTTRILLEDVYNVLGDIPIYLTATTNKATKVLADFNEDGEPSTIHSLLGLRVKNNHKTGKTQLIRSPASEVIRNSFILIDEISMADSALLQKIEEGTQYCRFLLVGDKDQLADIHSSDPPAFKQGYETFELKTVMRQSKDSGIVQLSDQLRRTVRTGEFLPIIADGEDVIHLDGEEFQMQVDQKYGEDQPPDVYKIICWKNDTVGAYNSYIRGTHHDIEHFDIGETVITNQPIQGQAGIVYSTDEVATITGVAPSTFHGIAGYLYTLNRGVTVFQASDQNEVKALLKQESFNALGGAGWATYFRLKEAFADLRPTHACTAYKSQGSSYEAVFIDLEDIGECRQWQQVARMLYVAVTRAKTRVYLYGKLPPRYHNMTHKVS